MSSEFRVLREAWQALDEPSPEVRDGARARLFEEIAGEESERLGRAKDQKPRRTGLRPRSRFAIVVVFGLLLLLVSATLTLALGWHVVFGSAQQVSHSSRIYEDFSTLDVGAPAGMETGVIPNQTRLVTTFGRVRLWVAPTRAGGYCSAMAGGGGCDRLGTMPLAVGSSFLPQPSRGGTPSFDLAYLRLVDGAINPRWSETVELRFEDGTVLRPRIVWVSAPISQGFFYVPIGNDHRRAGHQLREVVALNADGDIVDRDDGMWQAAHGWPYSDTPPVQAAVENAEQVAHVETPSGEAVLWHAPSRFETTCTWLSLAGHYYDAGCQIKGYPYSRVQLVRRGDVVLLYGVGIRNSASIRLDFADGHHIALRPNSDGDLLYRIAAPPDSASGQPKGFTVFAGNGKKLYHAPLTIPSTAAESTGSVFWLR